MPRSATWSTSTTLPADLLILRPSKSRCSACTQWRTTSVPVTELLCARSSSWWGKRRSIPPVCTSIDVPSSLRLMALHSVCQPGKPTPQGVSHTNCVRVSGAFFHKAQSAWKRLVESMSASNLCPGRSSSRRFPLRAP